MNRGTNVSNYNVSLRRCLMRNSLKSALVAPIVCIAVGLCLSATMAAHDIDVEQIVRVEAHIDSGLRIRLHVPLSAVTDAGLPATPEGRLGSDATPALLQPVGAQVLRRLDLREDSSLRPETLSVAADADGNAFTIDALYRVSSLDGVSANLNAFQSQPRRPVVTEMHVTRSDGQVNHLRVAGQATRVVLDPQAGDVARQFAAFAAHATLRWGDDMLMLICLLGAGIGARTAATRIGMLIGGLAIGALIYRLAGESLTALAPFPAVVSASIVVIAALYLLFGSREVIVLLLSGSVGVLHGTTLARAFLEPLPNSGVHHVAAGVAFFGFTLIELVWIAAFVFAGRGWLSGLVRGERVVAYAVTIFAVHSALHHMSEAGAAIDDGAFATTHAISLVTLGWLLVIVIAALTMRSAAPPSAAEAGARS